AAEGVLEVDLDAGDVVLARRGETSVRAAASTCAGPAGRASEWAPIAEQLREEIAEAAEVLATGRTAAGKLEPLAPVRRRAEVLALLPVGAELVVGRALFGVLQDLVRLLQ